MSLTVCQRYGSFSVLVLFKKQLVLRIVRALSFINLTGWRQRRVTCQQLIGYINTREKIRYFFTCNILKFTRDVTKEQRTDVIYSIPCNNCDNEYIGQTKRQFGTRLKEHQKAVFLCKKENSALLEHTCLTNHTIGWNNSKIITTNLRYHQRLCLEAWHINSAHAP